MTDNPKSLYQLTIFRRDEEARRSADVTERLMQQAASEMQEPASVASTLAGPPGTMEMHTLFIYSDVVLRRFLDLGGDPSGIEE